MTVLWQPSSLDVEQSQINQFRKSVNVSRRLSLANYQELYQWSIDKLDEFWSDFWGYAQVICSKKATQTLKLSDHMSKTSWFVGAKLNFAENLLRYRDDRTAIIFANESGVKDVITYKQLYDLVTKAYNYLKKCGVVSGDRVAAYIPNMPQAIIFMLATTAIGAIWTSTSPDFGEQAVIDRFSQVEPRVLITVDGYIYNGKTIDITSKVKSLLEHINSIKHMVMIDYVGITLPPSLVSAVEVVNYCSIVNAYINEDMVFSQLPFDHPGFILYSSGTTGLPKTIVHRAGGVLLTHLKEHKLHTDIRREDVVFYFTTTGWMMWNWLSSVLASGCTVVCYDGAPFFPQKSSLLTLVQELAITVFGTSAKYLSSLEEFGIVAKDSHNLDKLRTILSTGSILADHNFDFVYEKIKADVMLASISGGTDILSCFALGNPTLAVRRGEAQCRGLGYAVLAFDEKGNSLTNSEGELVCVKPAPSMPLGFWHDLDNKKFMEAYFAVYPNIWYHGDYIIIYEHGGVKFLGRSDAILNPQGVRIGTGEIYQVVDTIQEVHDSLAVGYMHFGDEKVILFVQLNYGVEFSDSLVTKIKDTIKVKCSARHIPYKVIPIADIPYTANGKKVELAVKNIINGKSVNNRHVLRNPESLDLYYNLDLN